MKRFRAWSIEYEEYIEDVIHDGPSWLEAHGYDHVNVSEIFDGDEFIVEQYTGLKDKNGKEICEGDIVGFKWAKRLYVVTYRIYDASFILENDEWEETIHLSLDKDHFEIFGNTHENPELLEEKKWA